MIRCPPVILRLRRPDRGRRWRPRLPPPTRLSARPPDLTPSFRVVDPFPFSADHAREQALDLALKRSRALDKVCAQNLAGRFGIAQAEGLAEAVL